MNISGRGVVVEPWAVRVDGIDLETLATTESVFALANGHIGMRGTVEEGEPRAVPGTFINGFHENRSLPYAEAGYGFPESGQTSVKVTDGSLIRLVVGDAPFDLRYGQVLSHERVLDLRAGTLSRHTEWTSMNGQSIRVTSRRLVSFAQRTIAAMTYEVESLGGDLYVALQSDLLANEPTAKGAARDPRLGAEIGAPLRGELAAGRDRHAVLVHQTERSGLRVAAGMDHLIEVPDRCETTMEVSADLGRLTIAARLPQGRRMRLTKFLAYGWSSVRSASALRDQVEGALATAMLGGWERLADEQRTYLDRFWSGADVEIEGDPELQQAVRFALFHVLQAGARAEHRPIPAKGLTGAGYDGHTFWDTESFVLPVLTYTLPNAARDALYWRYSTLDKARERAAVLGQRGAAFPWRTINGEECSGYWPAGTAAFHIGADIADAVARYVAATEDREFEENCGTELLVETARLWASLGHFDREGTFRIDGVTGPDEYTAVVDDNVYTNLMAQRNFREAADAARRWPDVATRLGIDARELDEWEKAADRVVLPYDERLGVHSQSEGFTDHDEWDFQGTPPEKYPLLLNYPYFELYRKQVVKQSDLVLAMHLRGDAFTHAEKVRNFAYYEARTVRDSSLSASTQAVVAAEVGQLQLAYDYWGEAALTDLHDLHHNGGSGLHIAALAGAWTAAVAGFGGMRDHGGQLSFAPRLPPGLSRLAFRMTFRGCGLKVDIRPGRARYVLLSGDSLDVVHHGTSLSVTDEGVTAEIPQLPPVEPVEQPPGRSPARRNPAA
jgi:alpha,alpha-trehalose phosphorylase